VPVAYVARILESWAKKAADMRVSGAQAPPAGRPPSRGEGFLAKLNQIAQPAEPEVVHAEHRPARLGR
jgi:hypothetical protein